MSGRHWDAVRDFALSLPNAALDYPWDEPVVKALSSLTDPPRWEKNGLLRGPMFVWLGRREAETPAVSVHLTASYDQAVALAGATPTTISGLGHWGWLTVRLGVVDVGLVCDWVDESYRTKAPKKLVAQLDAQRRATGRH